MDELELYTAVQVVWVDIECHGDGTWMTEEEAHNSASDPFKFNWSLGYLLRRDNEQVVITDSLAHDGAGNVYATGNVTKFPRSIVREVSSWISG